MGDRQSNGRLLTKLKTGEESTTQTMAVHVYNYSQEEADKVLISAIVEKIANGMKIQNTQANANSDNFIEMAYWSQFCLPFGYSIFHPPVEKPYWLTNLSDFLYPSAHSLWIGRPSLLLSIVILLLNIIINFFYLLKCLV